MYEDAACRKCGEPTVFDKAGAFVGCGCAAPTVAATAAAEWQKEAERAAAIGAPYDTECCGIPANAGYPCVVCGYNVIR